MPESWSPAAPNDELAWPERCRAGLRVRETAHGDLLRGQGADGGPIAIETVRSDLTADADAVAQCLHDLSAWREFSHEGIVRLIDAGRLPDGRIFVATEWIEGESLAARLQRLGPLPPDEALRIAQPICEALVYAHERGVLHRGLTLDDVWLGGGPQAPSPKLTRFGLWMLRVASLAPSSQAGAPTWARLAPECLAGLPADARSDVYRFGGLLYEALTGSPPPGAGPDTLESHRAKAPPELPDVSGALAYLIRRCLARNPDERFQDAVELASALEAAAQPTGLAKTISGPRRHAETPAGTGEVYGSYEVVRSLGEGGMGQVYLGRHRLLGRMAAIKALRPELATSHDLHA